MGQDHTTYPARSDPMEGGHIQVKTDVKALRKAIPAHCFRPVATWSLWYILRDVFLAASLAWIACTYISLIEKSVLRGFLWAAYGFTQGLFFTGLWVIGHECGHGSQFPAPFWNDMFGFLIHSALLTPYFSWKVTHRRHHFFANNLSRDLHSVPPRRDSYLASIRRKVGDMDEFTEDAPLFTFLRILLQQVAGWPLYLTMNITASPNSLSKPPSCVLFANSHFAPWGSLFGRDDALYILLSDGGLIATFAALWFGSQLASGGTTTLLLAYVHPYLWLNHWIVAITYLHHTDPNVPKYESKHWTFLKGATATVDRDLGWVGRHLLHGIADFHVVHHLFPSIPYYHAEEATTAIIPLLGTSYHRRGENVFISLWQCFTHCQYVEADETKKEPGSLWFRWDPSPGPEYSMGKRL